MIFCGKPRSLPDTLLRQSLPCPLWRESCTEKNQEVSAALYNDAMLRTNPPDMNVIVAAGGVLCRRTASGGDEILRFYKTVRRLDAAEGKGEAR